MTNTPEINKTSLLKISRDKHALSGDALKDSAHMYKQSEPQLSWTCGGRNCPFNVKPHTKVTIQKMIPIPTGHSTPVTQKVQWHHRNFGQPHNFSLALSSDSNPSISPLSLKPFSPLFSRQAMAVLSRLRMVAAAAPLSQLRLRLGIPSISRAYGSAAAQLQYDSDYELESQKENPMMEESQRSESGRGVQWVIMGDPMAKRHVYAEKLSRLLQVPHISMGTLVRQELHPHSALYKQIANAVNQGKLVPEKVIFGLLSKRLEEDYYRGETGFILEGIPRTTIQAEILDEIADIDLVLNFKCTKECLLKKHAGVQACAACHDFLAACHSKLHLDLPSRNDQMESSNADAEVALEKKLQNYAKQSKPLEDYYKQQKKLLEFQVAGAPGETWQGLLAALHLQHMSAVSSSQKLTA